MRLCSKVFAVPAVLMAGLAAPTFVYATSCTTQAALLPQDRDALTAAGGGFPASAHSETAIAKTA